LNTSVKKADRPPNRPINLPASAAVMPTREVNRIKLGPSGDFMESDLGKGREVGAIVAQPACVGYLE
jgi:hypothetical protein